MLLELGMELIAKVDRPAKAGDQITVICSHVDITTSTVQFSDMFVPGQLPDGSQAVAEEQGADGHADQTASDGED